MADQDNADNEMSLYDAEVSRVPLISRDLSEEENKDKEGACAPCVQVPLVTFRPASQDECVGVGGRGENGDEQQEGSELSTFVTFRRGCSKESTKTDVDTCTLLRRGVSAHQILIRRCSSRHGGMIPSRQKLQSEMVDQSMEKEMEGLVDTLVEPDKGISESYQRALQDRRRSSSIRSSLRVLQSSRGRTTGVPTTQENVNKDDCDVTDGPDASETFDEGRKEKFASTLQVESMNNVEHGRCM